MTNIYDVLSQLHTKATAATEEAVAEELQREDPPAEEAAAVLQGGIPLDVKVKYEANLSEEVDESTQGDDSKRSSRRNK